MKIDRLIKVTYRYIELPTEELQQRLDDAFDLLFRETMKTFRNSEGEKEEILTNTYDSFIQNNN